MPVLSSRVLLRPADLDAAVEFYERRLGLVRYRKWGTPAPRHRLLPRWRPSGAYRDAPRSARAAGAVRLWLQVADVAAACDELAARGVDVAEAPERKPWGLIEAVVHDPDATDESASA